ncbi:MAG TPA: PEGA domain-containing protein, partial [Bryobacteraceae bacterium]|nr:PEGA domain-containing protein [Bryobacteraceae bacterium]
SRVQVSSNVLRGEVAVNGRPAGALADGQLTQTLQPGRHELRIRSSEGEAAVTFTTAPARLPVIDGTPQAKDMELVIVTTFGGDASVACPGCSGQAIVDGRDAGAIDSGRMSISGLAEGTHELRAAGRSVVFQTGNAPSVAIQLTSAAVNAGTLIIASNEDGAAAIIDGKRYARAISGGVLRIPLEPGRHTVWVQKDGFRTKQPRPTEVTIARGDQVKTLFELEREMAALTLTNLPPATRVAIDGRPAGAVRSDGTFSAQVQPGAHVIELSQENYQPLRIERTLTGGTSRIDGATVRFIPVPREIPRPPELPRPNPAELERLAWNRIQNSTNEADFTGFLQTYPSGRYAADAGRKLEQLRWERVDNNDMRAVQEHLARFPNSQHAKDALERLRQQAAEEQARTAEKQRTSEAQKQLAADREAVKNLLRAYAEAYQNRNYDRLGQLRPAFKARIEDFRRSMERYRSVTAAFDVLSEPDIRGDAATVRAVLRTETVDAQRRRPETFNYVVKCVRQGASWVIDSMN